jgi:hypothetical protein
MLARLTVSTATISAIRPAATKNLFAIFVRRLYVDLFPRNTFEQIGRIDCGISRLAYRHNSEATQDVFVGCPSLLFDFEYVLNSLGR